MKRLFNIIVLLSMMTPFVGRSQKIDTVGKVWIPRADALRKLDQIERLKADSATLVIRNGEITELRTNLSSRDFTIDHLNLRVSAQDVLIGSLNTQITQLNKSLRKQKAKTTLAIIGGILTSGGLAYLLITK